MTDTSDTRAGFESLNLAEPVLRAIKKIGYEQPSPIQAQSIPHLIAGRDLLGVAQTGTGKTAAFALPLLSRVNVKDARPQVLVLAPTRELAIQVAEAFQRYAAQMKGFHIVPIYGGQEYGGQLRQLKRGVHVVVGTPGRVMDHIRKGSLVLDHLQTLVLDEADEMLRMGFIDDVEWILQHTPQERQTALFSATMPRQIRKVAETYLNDPAEVRIEAETVTVKGTEQRACRVNQNEKLDALTRILETRDFDGMLVFVRTKTATLELAERIGARGFAAAPLNGDLSQAARERTVAQLKSGKLDILIATDVAARGIDVPRISHVINFDIPNDIESYIHRIGRTGRAGREGMAITFVTMRESRLLRAIERATRSPIEWLDVPGRKQVAQRRIQAFKEQMQEILDGGENLDFFRQLMRDFSEESDCTLEDAAAALAYQLQRKRPLQPPPDSVRPPRPQREFRAPDSHRPGRPAVGKGRRVDRPHESEMMRYRIQVGGTHGATAGNIVGAITNEVGLDSRNIGRIQINDTDSTVDLPRGMPPHVLRHLQKVRIAQREMAMTEDRGPDRAEKSSKTPTPADSGGTRPPKRKPKGGKPVTPKAKATTKPKPKKPKKPKKKKEASD